MINYTDKGAVVDGKWKYLLWREWRDAGSHDDANWFFTAREMTPKSCLFIMLNPSIADAMVDDPTIRKCVKFAARENYERLEVVNLFAFRATRPEDMLKAGSAAVAVGPKNPAAIGAALKRAGLVVCAWGKFGSFAARDMALKGQLRHAIEKGVLDGGIVKALDFNLDGSPKHPLYVRDDKAFVPMGLGILKEKMNG